MFTSVTAFDKHQRVGSWGVKCLDPAIVGLDRKPSGRWGGKSDDRQRARMARFADRVTSVAENSTPLVSLPRGG